MKINGQQSAAAAAVAHIPELICDEEHHHRADIKNHCIDLVFIYLFDFSLQSNRRRTSLLCDYERREE